MYVIKRYDLSNANLDYAKLNEIAEAFDAVPKARIVKSPNSSLSKIVLDYMKEGKSYQLVIEEQGGPQYR